MWRILSLPFLHHGSVENGTCKKIVSFHFWGNFSLPWLFGGWTNPSEKIWSSNWIISPSRDEHAKIFALPTTFSKSFGKFKLTWSFNSTKTDPLGEVDAFSCPPKVPLIILAYQCDEALVKWNTKSWFWTDIYIYYIYIFFFFTLIL